MVDHKGIETTVKETTDKADYCTSVSSVIVPSPHLGLIPCLQDGSSLGLSSSVLLTPGVALVMKTLLTASRILTEYSKKQS